MAFHDLALESRMTKALWSETPCDAGLAAPPKNDPDSGPDTELTWRAEGRAVVFLGNSRPITPRRTANSSLSSLLQNHWVKRPMNGAGSPARSESRIKLPESSDFRRCRRTVRNKERTCRGAGHASPLAGPAAAFRSGSGRPEGRGERQEGAARRISWSTVSARTPNIRWQRTFACPRTRTWRAPNSSLRRALLRSTPERIR